MSVHNFNQFLFIITIIVHLVNPSFCNWLDHIWQIAVTSTSVRVTEFTQIEFINNNRDEIRD